MAYLSIDQKDVMDYKINKLKMIYMKPFYEKFKENNKDRFESTSPFAVTKEIPSMRIDSSPIITGGSGWFKGQIWIDTQVQQEKIYLCPVTHQEFTAKDIDEYKEGLRDEAMQYAKNKVGTISYSFDHATLNVVINTKDKRYVYTSTEFNDLLMKGLSK